MPDLTREEIEKYMITDEDRGGASAPAFYPPTPIYENCKITPLIDGNTYFKALYDEIVILGEGLLDPSIAGIYISGWWFAPDFSLTDNGNLLITLLREKAAIGVDVRIMVWANDYLLDNKRNAFDIIGEWETDDLIDDAFPSEYSGHFIDPMRKVEYDNLRFAYNERKLLSEGSSNIQVIINHLDHDRGSVHLKQCIVFCGNRAVAFTGGIDIHPGRKSDSFHREFPQFLNNIWHDVQSKLEGAIVQGIYNIYIKLWNEIISKSNDNTPKFMLLPFKKDPVTGIEKPIIGGELFGPVFSKTDLNTEITHLRVFPNNYLSDPRYAGTHYAQSLLTIPENDGCFDSFPNSITFTTKGIFQIELGLKKIISNANEYIYIEDQGFLSRTLFNLLGEALKDPSRPNLKLILFSGARDPNDQIVGSMSGSFDAINDYLLKYLNTEEQRKRVVFFGHNSIVHSKVWIVDDKVAIIGSANMMNRSLYTDIEHSVMFMDSEAVKTFRIQLWGEHFSLPPEDINSSRTDLLTDIEQALNIWNPSWFSPSLNKKLPSYAETIDDVISGTWRGYDHPVLLPIPGLEYICVLNGNNEWIETEDAFNIPNNTLEKIKNKEVNIGEFSAQEIFFLLVLRMKYKGTFIVCTSGANIGIIREITGHSYGGGITRLTFNPMPDIIDNTSVFKIYLSKIRNIPLDPFEEDRITEEWYFENIQDFGELS